MAGASRHRAGIMGRGIVDNLCRAALCRVFQLTVRMLALFPKFGKFSIRFPENPLAALDRRAPAQVARSEASKDPAKENTERENEPSDGHIKMDTNG